MIFLISHKKIKQLIVIEGPTASGKTTLSIALAKVFSTVILSSDSRQFYKEISIGTAKPSIKEQAGIKHYFIDSHNLSDELSSGQYEKEALEVLDQEFKTHDKVILVGGSGMFTDAVCYGLDNIPHSPELREEITHQFEENGLSDLLQELKASDPEYFAEVDQSNPARIIRAIEVIRLTGKKYSEQRNEERKSRPFEVIRFVIDMDREQLYERINVRVDQMIEAGLLDEVKSVFSYRNLQSLNTVGYKELFAYLDGQCSLEEAIDQIKQNTRRYAKRQLTWFRRNESSHWIDYAETSKMVDSIVAIVENSNLE